MNHASERTFAPSRFKGLSLIRKFINFSVYSNIFVASVTTSASLYWQLKADHFSLRYSLFLFFSTLFIYNFERSKIKPRDVVNKPDRSSWLAQNKFFCSALAILSFFSYSYLFLSNINIYKSTFVLSLLILSLVYCSDVLNKKVSGLKHILLGLIWSSACVLGPMMWSAQSINSEVLYLTVIYFLIAVVNSILCDLDDTPGDLEDGIKSLPVVMNEKYLKVLTNTLIITFSLSAWLLDFSSLLIIGVIYVYCLNFKVKKSTGFICDFALLLPLVSLI